MSSCECHGLPELECPARRPPQSMIDIIEQADVCKHIDFEAVGDYLESHPMTQLANDPVNHPAHYTQGKIEVIDFIEDKKLPYHLGNCIKYIARAGHKTACPKEDLLKARWYLDRYIDKMEQ